MLWDATITILEPSARSSLVAACKEGAGEHACCGLDEGYHMPLATRLMSVGGAPVCLIHIASPESWHIYGCVQKCSVLRESIHLHSECGASPEDLLTVKCCSGSCLTTCHSLLLPAHIQPVTLLLVWAMLM